MKVRKNITVVSVCIPISIFALICKNGLIWFLVVWGIATLIMYCNRKEFDVYEKEKEETRTTVGPTSYSNNWKMWDAKKQGLWTEYQGMLTKRNRFQITESEWTYYYSEWKVRWNNLMKEEPKC